MGRYAVRDALLADGSHTRKVTVIGKWTRPLLAENNVPLGVNPRNPRISAPFGRVGDLAGPGDDVAV